MVVVTVRGCYKKGSLRVWRRVLMDVGVVVVVVVVVE